MKPPAAARRTALVHAAARAAAATGAADTTAGTTEDEADEPLVERWIAELRQIVVGGQAELAARVGEFLIENVYGGSVEAALSHAPRKPQSLRRLAERAEEFGMRPTTLVRAVPIALQIRQLGPRLGRRLGVDQHRALLPVRDAAEKKLLAEAAVDAGWSARDLRRKVRGVQRPHRGGRPPEPPIRLLVRALDRVVEPVTVRELRRDLDQIKPAELRHLLARVNAAQALLEQVEGLVTRSALRGK